MLWQDERTVEKEVIKSAWQYLHSIVGQHDKAALKQFKMLLHFLRSKVKRREETSKTKNANIEELWNP